MERAMISNKYDLLCLLSGVISSALVNEFMEKLIITVIVMVISTTISFYWRRHLHLRTREKIKKQKENGQNNSK